MSRQLYLEALRGLEDELISMSDLASRALDGAMRSLGEPRPELAQSVVDGDDEINGMWTEIERSTLEIIATQQPMAGDLREVLAISAIATDLERIADHAKSIAAGRLNLDSGLPSEPLIELSQMAALARELLARSVDAFVERDGDLATEVAARDEEVDVRYHRITRRLLALMYEQPSTISSAYFLLKVAKNIERAGDHVTNICERVVFLVTGRIVDLGR